MSPSVSESRESFSEDCAKVPTRGFAVPIVKLNEEGRFELDEKALSNILLHDSVRNTSVVVVSIAGDFRKGKFLILFSVNFN